MASRRDVWCRQCDGRARRRRSGSVRPVRDVCQGCSGAGAGGCERSRRLWTAERARRACRCCPRSGTQRRPSNAGGVGRDTKRPGGCPTGRGQSVQREGQVGPPSRIWPCHPGWVWPVCCAGAGQPAGDRQRSAPSSAADPGCDPGVPVRASPGTGGCGPHRPERSQRNRPPGGYVPLRFGGPRRLWALRADGPGTGRRRQGCDHPALPGAGRRLGVPWQAGALHRDRAGSQAFGQGHLARTSSARGVGVGRAVQCSKGVFAASGASSPGPIRSVHPVCATLGDARAATSEEARCVP
jgi:hypothetical protein